MNKNKIRTYKNILGVFFLRCLILVTILFLILFLYIIFSKGYKVLSWDFISKFPKDGMTRGGVFPAIYGSFLLTVLSVIFAFPVGLFTAVFLTEYAKPLWLVNAINISINTLSGIPSIVFGLFGLAIFVNGLKFGVSLISGALTLAVLILPIIINSTVEAIKTVPKDFAEASFALGATKTQTIFKVVLPAALPGILTGTIISVGRAAGETAPILFTAATFYTRELPSSIFDEVMALPYHIYALVTEGTKPALQKPIAYGSALILLVLVLGVNLLSIFIRSNIRRKRKC